MEPRIIETTKRVNGSDMHTGHYRLVGIPGDYLDLPGRGGKVTKDAAYRANLVLAGGGAWQEASDAAWQK